MYAIDCMSAAGALQGGTPGAAAGAATAGAATPPADTRNPITTTSSVLALKYRDGVLMVADTAGAAAHSARAEGLGFE